MPCIQSWFDKPLFKWWHVWVIKSYIVWCGCTYIFLHQASLIARFMAPAWGPSGADRTQMGPMLVPWTLLSGWCWFSYTSSITNGGHLVVICINCWVIDSNLSNWSHPKDTLNELCNLRIKQIGGEGKENLETDTSSENNHLWTIGIRLDIISNDVI